MINCIIVEDENVAVKGLTEYISEISFLKLIGTSNNITNALDLICQHQIDLIFLDINLHLNNGFDLISAIPMGYTRPMIIITTAHEKYAIKGYQFEVLDYLLKPIDFQRFLLSVTKAWQQFNLRGRKNNENTDIFFVKTDKKIEKVYCSDVLYFEANQNYINIVCTSRKIVIHMTISALTEFLPSDRFLKVHRSYVVSIEHVDKVLDDSIQIGNAIIPVSKTYMENVYKYIISNRLLKR